MTGNAIKKALEYHSISPRSIRHYNENAVGLFFKPDKKLNELIKTCGGRWSTSCGCWYLPKKKTVLQKLVFELSKGSGYALHGVYEIKELERMLELKSYSNSTIKVYKQCLHAFTDHFDEREIDKISRREIEEYLLHLRNKKQSEAAIHSAINAIKFYYEQVLKKPREIYELQRPKKPLKNVTVFSENEVTRIINAISNIKHKAMLMIGYAAGLSVSSPEVGPFKS